MSLDAFLRRLFKAIEGFLVEAIHTDQLKLASIEHMLKGVHHAMILVLVKASFARGKHQHPRAGGAKNE